MSDPPHSFDVPPDKFKPATFTPPPPPGGDDPVPPPEPPPGPPPPPAAPAKDSVLRGFLLGLLAHTLQVILVPITGGLALIAIGISQLVYMLPFYYYFKQNGQPLNAKGILICMGVTFLLNAACTGLIFVALLNADFR